MATMQPASPALSTRALIRLAAVALIARAILLVVGPWRDPDRAVLPDSAPYLHLADNLKDHGTFGLRTPEGAVPRFVAELRAANGTLPPMDTNGLRPESYRLPGYPAFLAAVRFCGGEIRSVLVIQALLGALSACLVVGIAQALGLSARGALIAGLLWALHPAVVVYDVAIAPEGLCNAGVIVALFVAARLPARFGIPLAGLLLGLATLVRPVGLLYVPAALALAWPRVTSPVLAVLGLSVAAVLPPALWTGRNQAAGEGCRLTSAADLHLLYGTTAHAFAEERHQDWWTSWLFDSSALTTDLERRLVPGEDVIPAARRLALEELADRPGPAVRVVLKSLAQFLLADSTGTAAALLGNLDQSPGLVTQLVYDQALVATTWTRFLLDVSWTVLNAVLAVAALAGVAAGFRLRSWRLLIVGGLTLGLGVLATAGAGGERSRLLLMLPLVLLVASLFGRAPAPAAKGTP
jgi:hypothetical protein